MGRRSWCAVSRIIEKRNRAGKMSEVRVGGVVVPRDKVQKEISRHVALTLRSKFTMGPGMIDSRDETRAWANVLVLASPSPEPPDSVVICSPAASQDVAFLWDGCSPWLQFLASLRSSSAHGTWKATPMSLIRNYCSDA